MFLKRLYDLRTDHDLTQKQVADYLFATDRFMQNMKEVCVKYRFLC